MYDYAMVTKIDALAGAATACSCLRPSRPVALQLASLEVEALQARTANPYWERRRLVGIVRPMKDSQQAQACWWVRCGGVSSFQNGFPRDAGNSTRDACAPRGVRPRGLDFFATRYLRTRAVSPRQGSALASLPPHSRTLPRLTKGMPIRPLLLPLKTDH